MKAVQRILGFESSCDETGVALVEVSGDAPPRLVAQALASPASDSRACRSSAIFASSAATRAWASARARGRSSAASSSISSLISASVNPAAWAERMKQKRDELKSEAAPQVDETPAPSDEWSADALFDYTE